MKCINSITNSKLFRLLVFRHHVSLLWWWSLHHSWSHPQSSLPCGVVQFMWNFFHQNAWIKGKLYCMCSMNIHEHIQTALGCWPNSAGKAFNPGYFISTFASQRFQCQARQITSGSPLWRDWTKIISILDWRSWDRHVSAGKWTWAIAVRGVHSSKELFEQRINRYSVHLLELTTASFLLWVQKLSHFYI